MKRALLQYFLNRLFDLDNNQCDIALRSNVCKLSNFWNRFPELRGEWMCMLTFHIVKNTFDSGSYLGDFTFLLFTSGILATKYLMEESLKLSECCRYLNVPMDQMAWLETHVLKTMDYTLDPGYRNLQITFWNEES